MDYETARTLVWDFEEACLDFYKWNNEGNQALRLKLADQIISALVSPDAQKDWPQSH